MTSTNLNDKALLNDKAFVEETSKPNLNRREQFRKDQKEKQAAKVIADRANFKVSISNKIDRVSWKRYSCNAARENISTEPGQHFITLRSSERYEGETGNRNEVKRTSYAHLSKDQARELGEALIGYANK